MLRDVNRTKAILAFALGLVAAIVAVWWLSRDGAPAATDKPTDPARIPVADHGNPRANRGSSDSPDIETAPLVADDPHGALRLEGQVVEGADLRPVPNATVTIDSHPQRTTTTDASGGFAFDALVGRPYTLIAHAATGVAGPVTARLTAKSEPVVLHLRTAATLTVTVIGPGGSGVASASLELRGVDTQRATADGSGAAAFPSVIPGAYQLVGWADGLAHAYQRVRITAGHNTARLTLVRGAVVTGTVVDERGKPIGGARVAFGAAGELGGFGARRADAATTGEDGSFRFDAIPAGTFRFEGSHPVYAPGVSSPVTVDGIHEHSDVRITMSDGAIVRGRVVDAAKQPIVSARVRIGEATTPGRGGFGPIGAGGLGPPRESYSDNDGAFEIRGLPKRALVAVALHDTGASHDVAVDASRGDVYDVELVVDITGTISGVVLDPTGAPVEGVQVSARPALDGSGGGDPATWFAASRMRGMPQELSDGSGKFTMHGLLPGNYQLAAVRPPRVRAARRGGDKDGVLAKTGDTDVKIVLQPEGGVKGTAVAITSGAPPSLFTVVVGPVQQSFPSGGVFEVDDIPPGNYQLEVRGPEFQTKAVAVEIDPGKLADVGAISVIPGRTLSGVVIANGQPVPNATVYGGHTLMGTGTANAQGAISAMFNASVKQDETGSDGTFALSGFDEGDLSIVAERTDLGRSAPQLVVDGGSNQNALVLTIVPYGTLTGTVSQGDGAGAQHHRHLPVGRDPRRHLHVGVGGRRHVRVRPARRRRLQGVGDAAQRPPRHAVLLAAGQRAVRRRGDRDADRRRWPGHARPRGRGAQRWRGRRRDGVARERADRARQRARPADADRGARAQQLPAPVRARQPGRDVRERADRRVLAVRRAVADRPARAERDQLRAAVRGAVARVLPERQRERVAADPVGDDAGRRAGDARLRQLRAGSPISPSRSG